MGKIYAKAKARDFFIKEMCFFTSGGYALYIASMYGFPNKFTNAIDAVMIAITVASIFIIADCVSGIIVGFIHWIRKGYESNEFTYRSTTEAEQKNTNKHSLCDERLLNIK